ncbi:Coagulation factor XI [Trichinella pseudospiralis]|uniref:Coagulation factor XI n=1 Tax=Trichinella pseudospiralis TaxID=6337 RepID=A0A0V0Y3M2_TRIPS|nr:Coagulation factor XI [Trichinella pseudospiralis]
MLAPEKVEVLVGAHNVYKLDEETRRKVLVKNVIMHPKYNDKTLENDIALLQLRETVFYTTITRPASYGNPSAILQVAKVDVWADEKCVVNATSSICIGGRKDGRGGCQGDSGGPLLCEYNKRMVVFGVSSGNTGLCGQFNKPSLYTRVTFYLDWLKENSKNSGDVSGSASSTAGSSAISKPNKVKDDFADGASDKMNFSPKVSNVPSQPAFSGSRFMSPLPSPGRTATSRFYTPPSSSEERFPNLRLIFVMDDISGLRLVTNRCGCKGELITNVDVTVTAVLRWIPHGDDCPMDEDTAY